MRHERRLALVPPVLVTPKMTTTMRNPRVRRMEMKERVAIT